MGNVADKAFKDYGGGERGQRAYDAIMAHPKDERERAYHEKTWDPTHYADKAFQEGGQNAYDVVMGYPVKERHIAYAEKRWKPRVDSKMVPIPANATSRVAAVGGAAVVTCMKEERGRCTQWAPIPAAAGVAVGVTLATSTASKADAKPVDATPVQMTAPKSIFIQTPNKVGVWGCMIPGTDPRAAGASREEVERMCSESRSCVGYYADDTPGKTWYLATDTDPAKCTVKGREIYPSFYRKTTPI